MQSIEEGLRGHLWPILAVAVSCWILAHGGKLGANTVMHGYFDARRFPVAAVDYIEKANLPGPFFAPDFWGGYLVYRLYPQAKVVIDDRHDFYGEQFLRSYLKTMRVEPGWQDFLQQHPASGLVVPTGSALANILRQTQGWRPVHADDVATVYAAAPSENALKR